MHAFVPGGLHDHPPSTSSVMVVMQSLGKAEHQHGQPVARLHVLPEQEETPRKMTSGSATDSWESL